MVQEAELMSDEQAQQYYQNPEFFQSQPEEQPQSGLFSQPNDLKVIQEYNREENLPANIKKNFWGLASKSIKLGFWQEKDLQEIFLHKNIIKMGEIMKNPRHRYTFADRQAMNQMDLLVFADFKRGIGMERYKINERTLQATSVTQSIQGSGNSIARRGGLMSGIKNFFG